jgi:hypothetical protein
VIETELECADVELRLVEGLRPADDAAVAAHVRSCLRCFRTSSELRAVPQLSVQLRQALVDEQPDPGELFWSRFPKAVADAWEHRAAKEPVPASRWIWQRLSAWFQLPLPAALSGAAVAAALVLVVVHRTPVPRMTVAPIRPVAAPVRPAAVMEPAEDEAPAGLLGDDDPLDALELADARLVKRMVSETEASEEGSELGPSPAEELELLEADDLRAVAQALHGRGQI